jgi:hypothetical protein
MARTPPNVLNERNSLAPDGRGTIAYHLPRSVIALVSVPGGARDARDAARHPARWYPCVVKRGTVRRLTRCER